jgi:S-adenosylmethionine hydrolase
MITLTSDFGSPYPAAMRGVICQHSDARIVDIAHDLPRQDVPAAAFWCRELLPWFPPAVHCVVVDPGVGTDRAAIVVRAGEHVLVGPDNGVCLPAARELAGEADIAVYEIAVEDPASSTFHGRDVFAPWAARVHDTDRDALADLPALSPTTPVDLQLPAPDIDGDRARAAVLAIDDFGNVVTNVPGAFLDGVEDVRVDDEPVPVAPSYAHVAPGERLVTVGSHGNVECAVNRGRGDAAFGIDRDDTIRIER